MADERPPARPPVPRVQAKAAAPPPVKDTVPPPSNVPTLQMPSPLEVGPARTSAAPPQPRTSSSRDVTRDAAAEGPLGALSALLHARIGALSGGSDALALG